MVFSSSLFLFYFLPAFLTLYLLIPKKFRNIYILLASIGFYAWGAPLFVFLLTTAVVIDFFIAKWIHRHEGQKRKMILVVGIVFNVSMLLYFKYANFFVENLNELLGAFGAGTIEFTKVVLPIGISFFVFHELSYIIDVYRRVKPPLEKITDYALYIFLFPQLIAGPIIRFSEISDQIQNRNYQDNMDNRLSGLFRFTIGLAKKVLIANVLGEVADKVFAMPADTLSSSTAWLGAICYTFQIYFDFSGYSDMAIGLALVMGFKFPENFNNPYIAQSITEFWRRWHMSLSRWMRDYLYIPLGGNKVSVGRMYFNLWIVFIISGFWHGAQWTFVVWGAYHGLFLVLEKLFLLRLTEKIGKAPRILLTFLLVIVGWVFFRADTLSQAGIFLYKMFSFDLQGESLYASPKVIKILVLAALFCFAAMHTKVIALQERSLAPSFRFPTLTFRTLFIVCVIAVCFSEITASGFNPFIYFKF